MNQAVPQAAARARLALNASAWRALTDAQRVGWESLASQIQRHDSLGQSYTLNGFGAYVSVNNNNIAAGNAAVSDAPANTTPDALLTAVLTLGAAAFSVAYTATPLPAGARLFSFASPQRSAGRNFENDYRLIAVSAAAAASPANILAATLRGSACRRRQPHLLSFKFTGRLPVHATAGVPSRGLTSTLPRYRSKPQTTEAPPTWLATRNAPAVVEAGQGSKRPRRPRQPRPQPPR
jgi:hypothetical protein